ncbi:T9SS type A sorting domain-containing protein [Tamlana haliotis]|uniref:T9SS type A sorting domain-containing protein n=1 Tax=Pseudotamlana haliotis TaxID=2614804 RepID=A0A6N6MK89_9FLAO|nr:T9SS type A sorting domain-containing protein [Tamlana haliotis]KAB1070019.1 T9SS type A sorting domain-containing protein [Tamlana haliotis]
MKTTTPLILLLLFAFNLASGQDLLFEYDFEANPGSSTPPIYVTNETEIIYKTEAYFIRTDGTSLPTPRGAQYKDSDGTFFAVLRTQRITGSETTPLTLTFSDIDISGYDNLQLKVNLASIDYLPGGNPPAVGSWDKDDIVHFNAIIDNSTNLPLLWVESEENGNTGNGNGYPAIDTDFDALGELDTTLKLTEYFIQYESSAKDPAATGNLMDLVISFKINGSDEDIAIDNIEIWGVKTFPTPSTCNGGTATWDGSGWTGTTGLDTNVFIEGNYDTQTHGSFKACNLKVTSGHLLTINSNGTVVVENNVVTETNASLVIQPGSALVQHNDNGAVVNDGIMSLRRETAPMDAWYEYTYWSSPVESAQISTSIPHYNPNRLFIFNAQNYRDSTAETNNDNSTTPGQDQIDDNGDDWQLIGDTTMAPGIGYTTTTTPSYFNAYGSGAGTKFVTTFLGTFHNGVYEVDVYGNEDEQKDTNWNLIGNPYPSALDSDAFFNVNTNLERAIYFWSQNSVPSSTENGNQQQNFNMADFAIINDSGSVSSGGDGTSPFVIIGSTGHAIPSGQSFVVALSNVSGSGINHDQVTFNNSMRTESPAANSVFFKQETSSKTTQAIANKLWLNLNSTDNTSNQMLVGYVDGATNNDDGLSYDADVHPQNGALLYSVIPNVDKKFAIQGKTPSSLTANEVIPLGFKTTLGTNILYTMSLHKTEGDYFNHHRIILLDKAQSPATTWDLSAGDYIFSTDQPGEFNDRFEIIFKEDQALSVNHNTIGSSALKIIPLKNNNTQFTVPENLNIQNIEIRDLLGRVLYSLEGQSHSEVYNLPNLSTLYIARVSLSNGQTLTKKGVNP